jgi:hypothetical protein
MKGCEKGPCHVSLRYVKHKKLPYLKELVQLQEDYTNIKH